MPAPKPNRGAFWSYCVRAAGAAQARAIAKDVPFAIDAHVIDRLLVDQRWKCAVSAVELNAPGGSTKDPFGPSLDRIVPSLGYVPGNVRVVCNIVNSAMSDWGEAALLVLLDAMID